MSVTNVAAQAQMQWQLVKTNGTFQSTKQGTDSRSFALAVPVGVTAVYAGQLTIVSGANSDVNFESFTDLAGNAVTATKLYGLLVIPDIGATNPGGIITVTPSVTHGITGLFVNSTGVAVEAPGAIFQSQTTPIVLSATVTSINFAASGGGTTTADIVALVGA